MSDNKSSMDVSDWVLLLVCLFVVLSYFNQGCSKEDREQCAEDCYPYAPVCGNGREFNNYQSEKDCFCDVTLMKPGTMDLNFQSEE